MAQRFFPQESGGVSIKVTQEASLPQRDRTTRCALKFCQLLHRYAKNHIRKGSQYVNDLQGHSRLSELPQFNIGHI